MNPQVRARAEFWHRTGSTSEESAELKRLRRENSELRRANEILKAASAFFARELDPRLPNFYAIRNPDKLAAVLVSRTISR